MPRVERILSTTPVPVKQAQLIDPGAFRFSMAGPETLKQIGGVLEELGNRKIDMQDRIGVSNVNAAMENAQREYEKEIIGKPLEEHAAILQKHLNNAKSFAGQQRVTEDIRKLVDSKLQIWGDTFADLGEIATIKAIERDALVRVTADYEKALTEGTPEDIVETLAALDAQFKGSYEPAEAAQLKAKAEQRAVKQMEENAVSAVHAAIETATDPETGTGEFALARELAKNTLIDAPQRTTLRTAINSAETRFKNAKSSLGLAIQESTLTDTVAQLTQNPNGIGQEDFDALPLNDANKTLLGEKINERVALIEKGKADPWIESTKNRATASAISRVLDGTREEVAKVSVTDIIGRLGEITPEQAVELITKRAKRLDITNVINTPAHQRSVASLNRLRDSRLAMDDAEDDIEVRNEIEGEFGRVQNELEDFAESIKDDPDFDAKILKKQQILGRPIVEAVTLNWFEKMFSPKEQGFFTAIGFNTEAEELVAEKMDALKKQRIWKTLNDEEKASARKRFERGQTVQEVIDLL